MRNTLIIKAPVENGFYIPDLTEHISSIIIRVVHAILLCSLSKSVVAGFWRSLVSNGGYRTYDTSTFLKQIWKENEWIPIGFCSKVIVEADRIMSANGFKFSQLWMDAILKGWLYPPVPFLWFIQPFIKSLVNCQDIREVLVENERLIAETMIPGCYFVNLGTYIFDADNYRSYTAFAFDETFPRTTRLFPFQTIMAPFWQYLPQRFGAPAFDTCTMHSDIQSFLSILPEGISIESTGNEIMIDGQRIGHFESFFGWLEKKCILTKKLPVCDRAVFIADEPYTDRSRNQILLKPDCAYNAPVYLFSRSYRKDNLFRNPLESIAEEAFWGTTSEWIKVQNAHYEVIAFLKRPIKVTFYKNSASLWINDQHLTTGIKAKILRKIIIIFINEKRQTFQRREFIREPELISDPLDTGFSIRFRRLQKILEKSDNGIHLVSTDRGKFQLDVQGEVLYSEI